MTNFGNILVPVDFEASSRLALEVAADLAGKYDSRMVVFHAWDMPPYVYVGLPYLAPDVWKGMAQAAQEQLDATLAGVRGLVERAEAKLGHGPPALEILKAIEDSKADLVVMGTHGRQGLNRFVLGSVAERIVRSSPVPVLTVRGPAYPVVA